LIVVVVVVAVVVVLLIVGLVALAGFRPTLIHPGGATQRHVIIAESNSVDTIPAGKYVSYGPFTLPVGSTVVGAFTASGGTGASSFLLTSDEEQAFGSCSCASPSAYVWTSGQVSSASVSTNLLAGTYYLDLVNPDAVATTSVQITSPFVATYTVASP
jgi:hypothetical protein